MAKYRKRVVVVDATQWFVNGDHPEDGYKIEGKIVRFFRRPDKPGITKCEKCDKEMIAHGWIESNNTLVGGYIVCPGDWIITVGKDVYSACKPDIFEKNYEEA